MNYLHDFNHWLNVYLASLPWAKWFYWTAVVALYFYIVGGFDTYKKIQTAITK